jgi:hypothetical protein
MPGGEKGILAREGASLNPSSPDPHRNITISSGPLKPEQQELKEYKEQFIRVFG